MAKRKEIQQLLDEIESEYRFTRGMTGKAMLSPMVKQALSKIQRDKFVPHSVVDSAFANHPLPIGHGQTISQPYIVALMTDLLELTADDVVLEIGTGSGYQAAILSLLCRQVYTIEYVEELADSAKLRFERLGYGNIEIKSGNGFDGWPEHAPYDAIIVTAAATQVPGPLLEQLKIGGRMVIPVGRQYSHQELQLISKNQQGDIDIKDILSVVFVPFQGERNE
ncbi:MAG: protein-L-isoaspartate(D-aspartate) O-methyltransferase [Gammaproteobacteria bacterium]|nr:protein-L-isoaspartate(D-aspartate) O-methyltransferase [Gammaproteobacteria bacterium]MBT8133328.1 protein-L-isoaspartate(D-aspartate) O-methyltransferase [Gammaproteobacteria bacterium]NNJ50383.1 protein-L-isoaspartate(D-aspartate) O-methyltransferase [Gammaproteobacteria bacterium]